MGRYFEELSEGETFASAPRPVTVEEAHHLLEARPAPSKAALLNTALDRHRSSS